MFEHFDIFFADGGRSLFQIQFGRNRYHENIIPARPAYRNQRFKHTVGIFSQGRRDFNSADRAGAFVTVMVIGYFLPLQNAHDVGFNFAHGLKSVDDADCQVRIDGIVRSEMGKNDVPGFVNFQNGFERRTVTIEVFKRIMII